MKKTLFTVLIVAILTGIIITVFANQENGENWADEYIEKAQKIGLTNEFGEITDENITREEFCDLIYNLINIADDDIRFTEELPAVFEDTDNQEIFFLNKMGIIKGKSDVRFYPDDFLTREEAATILERIADIWGLVRTELFYEFGDLDTISDWAMSGIQTCANLGVMKGVEGNKFAPKLIYTKEQAVTTLVRMYEIKKNSGYLPAYFTDSINSCMNDNENYVFSPLSIKMALLMAANGADGVTKEEILETVGVGDLEEYNQSVKEMLEKYSKTDVITLNVSNSIWINSDKTDQKFSKEYSQKLKEYYNAQSNVVNNKNAVKEINEWVNDKTNKKIPEILQEGNNDFWSMLVNAVYFNARWEDEFSKNATKEDVFTNADKKEVKTDFMNKIDWLSYSDKNGVKIIELPYLKMIEVRDENGEYSGVERHDDLDVSMYFMISDEDFEIERALNEAEFLRTYINLSIPKFKIEYSKNISQILKDIGIRKAFESDAEFLDMFDAGNMWIDDVIHKTYLSIDEEGTEAAAVTAVMMAGSALPPEPIELKYNKPFSFVIRDNVNGEILFVGRYAYAE